jgi:hypothetical protein
MSNLTRARRLAFEAPDFRPMPGCGLVVFKRVGAGLRFLEEVPPGKEFQPHLLQGRGSLAAFAVSRDPNWEHEASWRLLHVDGVCTFTLQCIIHFQVEDAKRLVELIERDPLMRMEKMAGEIFGGTAARLPWHTIADDEEEMCAATASIANVERFRAFAKDYGVTVDRVALARIVSEKDLVRSITKKQREDAHYRHELAREDVDRAEELRARARQERFIDTGLESAIEVLRRASSQVGSFDEVETALKKLVLIRHQLRMVAGSSVTPLPPTLGQPTLLDASGNSRHGLADLLAKLGQVFAELAPGPAASRLGSAALHLVAEVLADGDEEHLECHRAALRERFAALLDSQTLTPEANQLLRHLQNVDAVRREIAGPVAP